MRDTKGSHPKVTPFKKAWNAHSAREFPPSCNPWGGQGYPEACRGSAGRRRSGHVAWHLHFVFMKEFVKSLPSPLFWTRSGELDFREFIAPWIAGKEWWKALQRIYLFYSTIILSIIVLITYMVNIAHIASHSCRTFLTFLLFDAELRQRSDGIRALWGKSLWPRTPASKIFKVWTLRKFLAEIDALLECHSLFLALQAHCRGTHMAGPRGILHRAGYRFLPLLYICGIARLLSQKWRCWMCNKLEALLLTLRMDQVQFHSKSLPMVSWKSACDEMRTPRRRCAP